MLVVAEEYYETYKIAYMQMIKVLICLCEYYSTVLYVYEHFKLKKKSTIKNTDISFRESERLALINYHPDYIGIIIINRLLYVAHI